MTPRAREHRFRRLKEMGCLPCWMQGRPNVYPEIHHLNLDGKAGQKRRGDAFTIPLCQWHHQGRTDGTCSVEDLRLWIGPSLKQSRAFRSKFGTDDALLAKTNDLIRQMDDVARGHVPEAEVSRGG